MLKHPFFHPGVHPTATCQVGKQNSSTGETRSAHADGSQLQFAAVIWSADQIQDGCWHHTGPELNSETCDHHTFCMACISKSKIIFSSSILGVRYGRHASIEYREVH